jgi:hypothetical protein
MWAGEADRDLQPLQHLDRAGTNMVSRVVEQYDVRRSPIFIFLIQLIYECQEKNLHCLLIIVALQQTQVHITMCI